MIDVTARLDRKATPTISILFEPELIVWDQLRVFESGLVLFEETESKVTPGPADGDTEALADALGLTEADCDVDDDALDDGLVDAEAEELGETEALGDTDDDGD